MTSSVSGAQGGDGGDHLRDPRVKQGLAHAPKGMALKEGTRLREAIRRSKSALESIPVGSSQLRRMQPRQSRLQREVGSR